MSIKKGKGKVKLPLSYETKVSSSYRVTVPKWISFIEPGDTIEGHLRFLGEDGVYLYEKKVSVNRHITIGHVKHFLPNKKLPPRVEIIIEQVTKAFDEGIEFNLIAYSYDEKNTVMNFSLVKPLPQVQLILDYKSEKIMTSFFNNTKENFPLFQEIEYEEHRWIVPLFFSLHTMIGVKIPSLLFLVMNQNLYQKFNNTKDTIAKLLQRYISWLNDINDLNKETLSKLSMQLLNILENQKTPRYYETKDLLRLDDAKRAVLLIALKEHKKGGLTLQKLSTKIKMDIKTTSDIVENFIEQGVLRIYTEDRIDVIDTTWVI